LFNTKFSRWKIRASLRRMMGFVVRHGFVATRACPEGRGCPKEEIFPAVPSRYGLRPDRRRVNIRGWISRPLRTRPPGLPWNFAWPMNAASRTLLLRCMLWGLLALCARAARAQQPAHYTGPAAELAHARELFDKAQYGAALFELDRIAESRTDPWADLRTEAEFWGAICAVRLQHQDATGRLLDFIDHHPENLHVPAVRLELFRHWFSKKRWGQAIASASEVVEQELPPDTRNEFLFKRGYAFFMDERMDPAQVDFAKVKDQPGIYAAPSTYYNAHINYVKRNYAAALEGFEKLKDDPASAKWCPTTSPRCSSCKATMTPAGIRAAACSPTRTTKRKATSTAWRVKPISAQDSTKKPCLTWRKACSAPAWNAATDTSQAMPTTRTGTTRRPLPSSLPW
jgi:hypothetical protein